MNGEAAVSSKPPGIKLSEWRVIILASLGGALEFYDFVIYSMFAQYIAAKFFPADVPLVSLMYSFAVFAVGYFARPFGGMLLSHFGDRFGRKPVLVAAILVMSLSTVAMGLLPSYQAIGIAATLLMVFLRVLQGFCLGGELPGAITFVVETSPRNAGFAAGTIFFCVNSGVGLAALLSLAIHVNLTPEQVADWGWRIGFIVGGVLGLISFWLRLSLEETKEFNRIKDASAKAPLAELLKSHTPQVIVGIAALAATGGFNGLLFAMPAFLPSVMNYPALDAIAAQNVCLAVLSAGLLPIAWLGDRIPRRWILFVGGLLGMALALPFFHAADARSVNLYVLFALAGATAWFFNGVFSGIVGDLFPTRIRFSGVALVLNISFSVFSGLAPLAATALVASTGSPTGAAYFMIGCAALAFLSSLVLRRYDGRILGEIRERQDTNAAAAEASGA